MSDKPFVPLCPRCKRPLFMQPGGKRYYACTREPCRLIDKVNLQAIVDQVERDKDLEQ